jgi:phosphohistidine phosphatase
VIISRAVSGHEWFERIRVQMKRTTTKNKIIIIVIGTPKRRRVNLINRSSQRLERIKFLIRIIYYGSWMKILVLLRHAKSSWKDMDVSDHDRPLNKRGKRDAPRMGRLLQKEELMPDIILSSTAVRARDTAVRLAKSCYYIGQITYVDSLYLGGTEAYLNALKVLSNDFKIVLVVGHNPDIEELVMILTGQAERIPTAALARIDLTIEDWSTLSTKSKGRLVRIWKPKELG